MTLSKGNSDLRELIAEAERKLADCESIGREIDDLADEGLTLRDQTREALKHLPRYEKHLVETRKGQFGSAQLRGGYALIFFAMRGQWGLYLWHSDRKNDSVQPLSEVRITDALGQGILEALPRLFKD